MVARPDAEDASGAELNLAENLLRFDDDPLALEAWSEEGREQSLTYRLLFLQVEGLDSAL